MQLIKQLFPWPCSVVQLNDWENKKQKIYEFTKQHPYQKGRYQPMSNYDTIRTNPDRLKPACEAVQDIFGDDILNFAKTLGAISYEITLGWTQTSFKGMEQGIHNHGYKGFSATCYVDFDPSEHTSTVFYEPLPSFWDGQKRQIEIPNCNEGTLILFPAYADHLARPNESEKPRTIFAFNFNVVPHESVRPPFDDELSTGQMFRWGSRSNS